MIGVKQVGQLVSVDSLRRGKDDDLVETWDTGQELTEERAHFDLNLHTTTPSQALEHTEVTVGHLDTIQYRRVLQTE